MFSLNSSTTSVPFINQIGTSLFIDPKKIFNSFETYHFINCSDASCHLCALYHSNSNTYSFINIFRLLLKQNKVIQHNDIDCVLSSMLLMLYFRFHNKLYKYYRQYHKLLYKLKDTEYQQIFINYINLLFASFANLNNESYNISLYLHITTLASLNSQIQFNLSSLKEFVMIEEANNQYQLITRLASNVTNLQYDAEVILLDKEGKGDSDSSEPLIKKIKNIYLYNTVINKFIMEKLLNKPLNSISPIEPDQLTDYFSSHFCNDSFLMLGVHSAFLIKESISAITVLKTGHSLIEYEGKNFSKLMPHKLRVVASETFLSLLQHHDIDKNFNKTFEFIVNDSLTDDTVSSFRYKFDLLHVLSDDTLLIYGFYSHPEKNIMLFEQNEYDSTELTLWRYSQTIQALLLLPIKIIDKAREIQFFFTFDNLFTSVRQTAEDSCTNNLIYNSDSIECLFDLSHYSTLLEQLLEQFDSFSSSYAKCFTEEITNAINKLKAKSLKQIKLTFKCTSTIRCDTSAMKVYSIKLSSANHHTNITTSNLGDSIYSSNEVSPKNNTLIQMTHEAQSNSSVAENYSINSVSSYIQKKKNNKSSLLTLYHSQEDTQKKSRRFKTRLSLVMHTIFIFNAIIIVLCVAFLIIQIKQLKSLYYINHLYFQFKQLRILFTHVFLTIFSNICIGKENSADCVNAYIEYSEDFMGIADNSSLPGQDVSLLNSFLNFELKYKAGTLLTQFNENKVEFYQYKDKEIINILSQKMNYSQIIESNDALTVQVKPISFDESLKNCINSIQIIINHTDYIYAHPIYILSYSNGTIDFTSVYKRNLEQIQMELYGIIINFLSYTNVFNLGERLLTDNVAHVNSFSKALLLFSIGVILALNFLLFVLCLSGFRLVQKLLLIICKEIITALSKQEVKEFFEVRLGHLLTINKLYAKDPNSIITSLLKIEKSQMKKTKQQIQKTKSQINTQLRQSLLFSDKKPRINKCRKCLRMTHSDSPESSRKDGIKRIVKPYRKLTYFIFSFFFFVDFLFGWLVFNYFMNVLNLSNYVQMNYIFENALYTNIGIMQIMSLLSMNSDDIAYDLGFNPTQLDDSILNRNIRDTLIYFDKITLFEEKNQKTFPRLSSLFDNISDCSSFINQINDTTVNSISSDIGINYTTLIVAICNKMNVLSLPHFSFLYNDIMLKLKHLQMYEGFKTYAAQELLNHSYQLYDLYTLALIILRPLRNYIKKTLLAQRIDMQMSQFIVLMGIFLAVNIVMTVTIFLLIKCFIFNRLRKAQQRFDSLKQCFLIQ